MILFENSLMRLNYDPASDILEVEYPDLHDYLLAEIKYSIDLMVDMMKNYDVKRLLLDSTNTVVHVSQEESREIATYLAAGIMKTRVQKVARVQSAVASVEEKAKNNMQHIRETQQLPFQLQNFSSKTDALDWLVNNAEAGKEV